MLKPMKVTMIDRIRAQVRRLPHPVRWLVVLILGALFILAGIVMLVLPGPGILFIGLGFAVLAIEFTWAEVVLHRAANHGRRIVTRIKIHTRRISRTSRKGGEDIE
jgi:uncharacterized protein (TIGR02611 family)